MRILPLLTLTGCLATDYDLPSEELARCEPQIQAMERACIEQNGTFGKAVTDARECFTEDVKIICSDFGGWEGLQLIIQPK